METLLFITLALGLVALNGFFVAAEFGMVRLRPTRIRAIAKRHGLSGRILAKVHGQTAKRGQIPLILPDRERDCCGSLVFCLLRMGK